jgi:hypothetical protein
MQNHITVTVGEGFSHLHYARVEDGYVVCGAADNGEVVTLARYANGGRFCIGCAKDVL